MSDGGMWSGSLPVERTALYHALGPTSSPWTELWIVLHGYGQRAASFLRRFRRLDDGRRLIVAPEALSRFYVEASGRRHGPDDRVGASWMTRAEREDEIRDYVAYLDRVVEELLSSAPTGEGPVLRVLGFSQGGHTAARWSVRGRWRPAQLVLWGSHLPPDLEPERASTRLAALDLVLVHGRSDPFRDEVLSRQEEETLERWGVSRRRLEHPGGHEIATPLLERISRETDALPRR